MTSTTNTIQKCKPDVVRSITRRQLLKSWLSLAVDDMPKWSEWCATDSSKQRNDVVIYEVVNTDQEVRFRIIAHGQTIRELYDAQDEGKFLDEALPESIAPSIHEFYCTCVARKRPVYTISSVPDRAGRPVTYERLLLPFQNRSEEVEIIVGSIEAISVEGRFEAMKLMLEQSQPPDLLLKAIICE